MGMRLDKLTIKAQEALQEAQSLAEGKNHQQIEAVHLLHALALIEGKFKEGDHITVDTDENGELVFNKQ